MTGVQTCALPISFHRFVVLNTHNREKRAAAPTMVAGEPVIARCRCLFDYTAGQPSELSFQFVSILSFSHSLILSFFHSLVLSFSHSLILSFPHSLILSFSHSLILSFSHSLILSFFHSHSLILSSFVFAHIPRNQTEKTKSSTCFTRILLDGGKEKWVEGLVSSRAWIGPKKSSTFLLLLPLLQRLLRSFHPLPPLHPSPLLLPLFPPLLLPFLQLRKNSSLLPTPFAVV